MEISPEYSLEGLMLKLKLEYFGHLMQRTDWFEKTLMLGKIESRRRREWQGEMVGWYHLLNGHEFEQAPGDGEGQGSLACCSPWGHRELDTTERLNNKNNKCIISFIRNWLQSISSVQFSCSVMSDSLWPHELQHTRPPCPSPTPGVHSNSCPLSPWCHPAISSSVVPFSSCPSS